MILFYDFDGTLTPYSFPQYKILKECNMDNESFMKLVKTRMIEYNIDLYTAYYETFIEVLKANNYQITKDTICTGSNDIEFNDGVFKFLTFFSKNDVFHYIITSGLEEYVKDSKIKDYVTDIFGSTFFYDKDSCRVDRLVTSSYKIEVIKKVLENHNDLDIFYLGDGLTDMEAFEYVHSINGKSIFLSKDGVNDINYKKLREKGIIDECFEPSFSFDSDLFKYLYNIYENRREQV